MTTHEALKNLLELVMDDECLPDWVTPDLALAIEHAKAALEQPEPAAGPWRKIDGPDDYPPKSLHAILVKGKFDYIGSMQYWTVGDVFWFNTNATHWAEINPPKP